MDEMNKKPNGVKSEKYIYVDIFDIPDVMKVRTQYKISNEALYRLTYINRDAVVKLAEEIQPFVHHREERDFATEERTITDTLFVIPPDCKRLAIPKPEPEKENEWIPVSERLPENMHRVLIAKRIIEEDTVVDIGWYFGREKTWYTNDCVVADVVAWMELPKKYENEVKE